MIELSATADAIVLLFYSDGELITDLSSSVFPPEQRSAWFELLSFIDRDLITIEAGKCHIPLKTVYDSIERSEIEYIEDTDDSVLSPSLLSALQIPKVVYGKLEISSRFSFSSDNFALNMRWIRNANNAVSQSLTSPLIEYDGESCLIERNIWNAFNLVYKHQTAGKHTQEENFEVAAKLRELSRIAQIEFTEGRIAKDDIEHVESIRPIFHNTSDGGVDLSLEIDSGENELLIKAINESTDTQTTFSTRKGEVGERKRFVLSENAKVAVDTFKHKRHFTRQEKRNLFSDPQLMLPGFDLSDYGERVIGFGVLYAPTVSAVSGDDKQNWTIDLLPLAPEPTTGQGAEEDDVIFENETNPTASIPPEEFESILEQIFAAEAKGQDSIILNGQEILITDELKNALIENRKLQHQALIVESNIDETNFDQTDGMRNVLDLPQNFSYEMPRSFSESISLYSYQKYGYGWFRWLTDCSSPGCLLADDMGMGKTFQVAALFADYNDRNSLSPSLLVVPPILIDNWYRELKTAVPMIRVSELPSTMSLQDLDDISKSDVFITTYQGLLRNQQLLGTIDFQAIVCDEAQHIKNPAAARTQAALAMQGRFKIALTATPIENSISELWSILDYSIPGYLPPLRTFNKYYGELDRNSEEYSSRITELTKLLEPVVLRRMKEDFLTDSLPTKEVKYLPCQLDQLQETLQVKIQQTYQFGEGIQNFFKYFRDIILGLTNPELLNGEYGIVFPSDYLSPKLKMVTSIIDDIKAKDEKCLLFADLHVLQAKLKSLLEQRYDININIINGNTSKAKRDDYTMAFGKEAKPGFDILILSPKCAGFGLNLVGANHVIHYLRSFNPAVENQATDRVYRIGQKLPVTVYYMVAKSHSYRTVEEKLHDLIESKKHLLKNYLTASEAGKIATKEFAETMGISIAGVSILDVDNLTPLLFEKYCSILFSKMGYSTELTPLQDFGADVICVGSSTDNNCLIQCKMKLDHTKGTVSNKAVSQIVGAKGVYEDQHNLVFSRLVVITNGQFSKPARIQASKTGVELIDRNKLFQLTQEHPVDTQEILSTDLI